MLDAIVMDMDGTLLDPNNKILPETKEALITCQKQGTKASTCEWKKLYKITFIC